jgi:hypothetical protein
MLLRAASLLLLIALIAGQPNYQERVIYYSEKDAVCCSPYADMVNLIINLDDRDRLRRTVRGGTSCSSWTLTCSAAISPSSMMYLLNNDERVDFHQETTRKYVLGLLHQIIQKVTVTNPATINNVSYNCTIFGDGTQQHFGVDTNHDPA